MHSSPKDTRSCLRYLDLTGVLPVNILLQYNSGVRMPVSLSSNLFWFLLYERKIMWSSLAIEEELRILVNIVLVCWRIGLIVWAAKQQQNHTQNINAQAAGDGQCKSQCLFSLTPIVADRFPNRLALDCAGNFVIPSPCTAWGVH